jgi:quercetin dioxygenase-like cupin family protein
MRSRRRTSASRFKRRTIVDMDTVRHILHPGEGEVLKLGPPAAGEVVIQVDRQRTSSPFVLGTETLLPGAEIPVHRHLHQDEVLFVHKGQGRATLEGQVRTVVPGTTVYVPRQAWHGLRNTGTGVLQMTWTAAPPGIEEFFREFSKLAGPVDPATIQDVARRHGIEFRPASQPGGSGVSTLGHRRRRRHRGGRGRKRQLVQREPLPHGQRPQQALPREAPPPLPPSPASAASSASTGQGRRRRHHRRSRSGRGAGQLPRQVGSGPGSRAPIGIATPIPQPSAAHPPKRSQGPARPPRRGRHQRSGHVKEVYMGGRWVRVVGEGPVIAP